MTLPAVTITELDGSIGVVPSGGLPPLAVVGPCDSGTVNVPAPYAKKADVIANHGGGPVVQAACFAIETHSRPVVLVPTGKTVAGDYLGLTGTGDNEPNFVGTGTSVITVDLTTLPNDDYEFRWLVVTGGTIGTAGITFKYSLDDGRTWSPVQALGVATEWVFPNSGGVELEFAAGTLVAGDYCTFRSTAPCWDTSELTAALTALKNYGGAWEICEIVGPLDATSFAAVETAFSGMFAAGKYRHWIGHFRLPEIDESEATYSAAFDTAFSSAATTYGMVTAHWAKTISGVDGKIYHRPPSYKIAAWAASVSEETNLADTSLGSAVGVTLTDVNGNPEDHDEAVSPGLDDMRATVFRTHEGLAGTYVNLPRILSAAGSDFQLQPHRRVLNLANAALRLYFLRRLNKPVLVNATSGYILEEEALEIEAGADQAVRSVLMAKPKASGGGFNGRFFQLSRTDDLLATQTMTGQLRVVPLAYPRFVNLSVGFYNPAMALVKV